MALLCFLLDLRTIPPPLLRQLKQCLLQLANLYAVSSGRADGDRDHDPPPLKDRIGLCYVRSGSSPTSPAELKFAYRPAVNFSLRDFHHAVNNLPMGSFVPESNESIHVASGQGIIDVPLASLLSVEALYAWGGEDVLKKLIAISTLFTNSEALQKSLMDAAERCVMVEFVVLEPEEVNPYDAVSEKSNGFANSISDLENCVLRRYLTDTWVLSGLVKGWFQELRNNTEEPVQAVILFKNTILGSIKNISCNLFPSSNQIIDGFTSCQTCRCHGYPISNRINKKARRSCPQTGIELGAFDYIENAVKVGEQTVLFLPSFEGLPKRQPVSMPVTFNVVERTKLASLDEGVIAGTSYVAAPSACHELEAAFDENSKSELNIQIFHGLCGALFQLDQGLVCSSTCNMETMTEGTFRCFYVLQPSDRGLMLLRRIAGSEEILPIPDTTRSNDLSIPEDVQNSIQTSISKIELRDYNPLQHERGFHQKLNWLVKESLQFGSIPLRVDINPELLGPAPQKSSILDLPSSTQVPKETRSEQKKAEEKAYPSITEEWEQLLVIDDMDSFSPAYISKQKSEKSTSVSKPLDEKTSRILERLEPPKQQKQKSVSPTVQNSVIGSLKRKPLQPLNSGSIQPLKPNSPIIPNNVISSQMKKPLLPFSTSSSQALKPSFQRSKRKQK